MMLAPGTKIHVSFDAEVRPGVGPDATTPVRAEKTEEGDGGTLHYLYLGDSSLFKTLPPKPVLPAFWPPVVGDVWLHGPSDLVYVVRANSCYPSRVVLTRNNIRDQEHYVDPPGQPADEAAYDEDSTAVPSEWVRLVGSADE
jgi:hypothetical protein